ncbi:hypothetical protein HHK36_006176 [Tetracentron sinense]|uniref:Uncharacterized protein n=1 Tax=Tetracentron sinense TaxID=13715 RepID=A0A834ZHK6_TETSI|nr:hypothetical protein HHK36_006176 [Tetracentron sinense]
MLDGQDSVKAFIKRAWAPKIHNTEIFLFLKITQYSIPFSFSFNISEIRHIFFMMLKLWKWYQKCLTVHPVKTQIISSGFLWGVGDIAAQTITHSTLKKHHQNSVMGTILNAVAMFSIHTEIVKWVPYALQAADEEFKINWKRVAITSMFGFGFVGPVGHFWYEGLDRFIRLRLQLQPKSLRFVATKVAIDAIIFGPLDLFVFFTYMGFSTGKSVAQVKEDVKRDFLPALILEGGVWPIVQVANFRFIPVRYQLLYVNVFCLMDSAFLSWIEQQQDAPWKQWLTSFLALKEKEGQGG